MISKRAKQELIFEKLLSYSRNFNEVWDAVRMGELEIECNEEPLMIVNGFTVDGVEIFGCDFNKWLEEKESPFRDLVRSNVFMSVDAPSAIYKEKPDLPTPDNCRCAVNDESNPSPFKCAHIYSEFLSSGGQLNEDLSMKKSRSDGGSISSNVEIKIEETKTFGITELKYIPETDNEGMLVEALLRKCRGESVERRWSPQSPWEISDTSTIDIDGEYRASLSKLDNLRKEIEDKLDTSALDVFDVILNEFDEIRDKLEK